MFMAVISIVLTFLLLEFGSRQFLGRSNLHLEFRFTGETVGFTHEPVPGVPPPQPYTGFATLPYGEELNRLGYRGPVPKVPKDTDEFRVFTLGGSALFFGKPPIPKLLEEEFRANGLFHVHVYNFAVVSSVSGMELARIVFEIADLEPDLILMYNGGNDIVLPFLWDPRPGYPFDFMVLESNPVLGGDVSSYPLGPLAAFGSNLFRHLFSNYFRDRFLPLDELRAAAAWKSQGWRDEIARVYVSNLIKSAEVSRGFGAEFLALFQPLVYFRHSPSAQENRYTRFIESMVPGLQDHCVDTRERVVSEIDAAEAPAAIADLSAIFAAAPEREFVDFIHITQRSKRVVAREIYRQIVTRFELGNPQPNR
jgi:hypothetical protein